MRTLLMPELAHAPYSYREDSGVPAFDDSKALFVFDGMCVLCSGGAAFAMRHDRRARVNFTPVRYRSRPGALSALRRRVERNLSVGRGRLRLYGKRWVSAAMRRARGRMASLAGGRHRARTVARCSVCTGGAQSLPLVRQGRALHAPHARAAGEVALMRERSCGSVPANRSRPPGRITRFMTVRPAWPGSVRRRSAWRGWRRDAW